MLILVKTLKNNSKIWKSNFSVCSENVGHVFTACIVYGESLSVVTFAASSIVYDYTVTPITCLECMQTTPVLVTIRKSEN